MSSDLVISYGSSIKSLEQKGDLVTVGAHGILWGSEKLRDLGGDWFTPETYLGATKGLNLDTMLHHGIPLSKSLKSYSDILLPATVKAEADEHGLLVATVLDLRDAYHRKMYELSEEEAFSWSSGANTRGVRRRDGVKAGEIVQWPLMEFSFTPTPAEPRMAGISNLDALKSAPAAWFEFPSYAKAVRVLSDLKGGKRTTEREEVKAATILFPYGEPGQEAVASVIREACDRLAYGVLYEVFAKDTPSSAFGLRAVGNPTREERLAYLDTALEQFSGFIARLTRSLLEARDEEEAEDAAKSLRAEFLNLKAAAPDAMAFADQSDMALAAIEGLTERVHEVVQLRAKSRPNGRGLSHSNYERVSAHESALKSLLGELSELLKAHGPDAPKSDQPPGSSTKAKMEVTADVTDVDAELVNAELRFKELEYLADGIFSGEEVAATLD